jgi:hypothetical protein
VIERDRPSIKIRARGSGTQTRFEAESDATAKARARSALDVDRGQTLLLARREFPQLSNAALADLVDAVLDALPGVGRSVEDELTRQGQARLIQEGHVSYTAYTSLLHSSGEVVSVFQGARAALGTDAGVPVSS